MVFHGRISMRDSYVPKCLIACEVRRHEQNFEIHHIVNDDLYRPLDRGDSHLFR